MDHMNESLVWVAWIQVAIILVPTAIAMGWLELRDYRSDHRGRPV